MTALDPQLAELMDEYRHACEWVGGVTYTTGDAIKFARDAGWTPTQLGDGGERIATGCVDLCVSCSCAVRTFANLQVVGDEKHLAPTWMPAGGCTCSITSVDPDCPRCFPGLILCQECGERSRVEAGDQS